MKLLTEKQLKVIKSIPPEQRILHCDATGGLVSIPKYMREYNQILNYALLLKDGQDLVRDGICIMEMSTSRHDAYSIGNLQLFS